jgi:SAM-dependent methyltransferase
MQFDQFAGDYKQVLDKSIAMSGEESEYFADYKARCLARILPPHFSGRVLDFGCGVGLLSRFIRQHLPAANINGFDVSAESINKIDPELAQDGTFTSDLSQLSASYDLIVVANVMHHIEIVHREATILNLARYLCEGGKLAIFEHNPANPLTRRVVERCTFDEGVVLLPPKETRGYLVNARLKVRRHDYIVFMPRFLAWFRRVEPLLAGVPLGAQYVMVGEKHA